MSPTGHHVWEMSDYPRYWGHRLDLIRLRLANPNSLGLRERTALEAEFIAIERLAKTEVRSSA